MHLQTFRSRLNPLSAVPVPLGTSDSADKRPRIRNEKSWRCVANTEDEGTGHGGILVSRWIETSAACRNEKAVLSSHRQIIGIALKATRVKLTRGSLTVFDGPMPAGTLYISALNMPLTGEFYAPCDFLHVHVSSEYLRECQEGARPGRAQPIPDLNDLIVRDPLVELLGKALVQSDAAGDGVYLESVAETLVMHVARLGPPRHSVNALPKWQMKRVQEYVSTHLDEHISLADLAKVTALSPMHFAAQFRASIGYRPHDYLLQQRIERAMDILLTTDMALVEVALTVGFHAQAHFSTVFKRLTGETPARWRRRHCASSTPVNNLRTLHGITSQNRSVRIEAQL
jgi:AraC family transcriptional regulator